MTGAAFLMVSPGRPLFTHDGDFIAMCSLRRSAWPVRAQCSDDAGSTIRRFKSFSGLPQAPKTSPVSARAAAAAVTAAAGKTAAVVVIPSTAATPPTP